MVVPTLNEEKTLLACLDAIGEGPGIEVLVSDGGSTDGTIRIAERHKARVVAGDPGRGTQLNRGAVASTAERLLFVHADCRLPFGWCSAVQNVLDDDKTTLACFRLRTEAGDGAMLTGPGRLWMRTLDLRSHGLRLPYGDQGFAVRRDIFDRLGGFPDIPLMEDLEFARRCKLYGRIRRIPLLMRTTARRTEGQPLRGRAMMVAFPLLYRLGVSPQTLARWYGEIR